MDDLSLLTQDNAEATAGALVTKANELARAIIDDTTAKHAAEFIVTIKGARKKWDSIIGPVCDKTRTAWQEANALRKKVDDPLDQAEKQILSPALSAYRIEQERRRREEEERRNAEAKRKAEEEALDHAVALESAGAKDAAAAVLDEPILPPPVVMPAAPKVAGLTEREVWSAEVVDIKALIQAVVDGKVQITALEANMPFLNGLARAQKGEFNVPGVKAVARKSFAGRA